MLLTWRWYIVQDFDAVRADRRMARLAALLANVYRPKDLEPVREDNMMLYYKPCTPDDSRDVQVTKFHALISHFKATGKPVIGKPN